MNAQVQITKGAFDEFLGHSFTWEAGPSQRFEMKLISVESVRPAGQRPQNTTARESFSLIFCALSNCSLPQGIYRTQHPKLGLLEVFLVPIGLDPQKGGMRMEAVYNFSS